MEKERTSVTEDEIEISTGPVWTDFSGYCGTHLITVTRVRLKVVMRFCKSLKRLVGAAGWTRSVSIKNRRDRRQLRKAGLSQERPNEGNTWICKTYHEVERHEVL